MLQVVESLISTSSKISSGVKRRQEIIEKGNHVSNYFLTCGTSMGHLLNFDSMSVCKKLDKKCGCLESGWCNEYFVTGLQYIKSTINQEQKRYYNTLLGTLKKYSDRTFLDWETYLTGALELYSKEEIWNGISKGEAEYRKFAYQADTCEKIRDKNEIVGEYKYLNKSLMPSPKITFIGKSSNYINKHPEARGMIETSLKKLEISYPNTLFIYVPNFELIVNRKAGSTGVNVVSIRVAMLCDFLINNYLI